MASTAERTKQNGTKGRQNAVARVVICALCLPVILIVFSSCATLKDVFAVKEREPRVAPIANPFNDYYYPEHQRAESIVLRSRDGDRSVEVEIPRSGSEISNLVIPMNTQSDQYGSASRGPAGIPGGINDEYTTNSPYKDVRPSISDREITRSFGQANTSYAPLRDEIEKQLGVTPAEDEVPESEWSYLAAVDHIKGLYKRGRYEAALLDIDKMLRSYPTDPRLYEMRGTLLDRLGKPELALKSWNQALRFDPSNQSLRKFIEKKQLRRSVAGGGNQ